jgi:hypothetical protein
VGKPVWSGSPARAKLEADRFAGNFMRLTIYAVVCLFFIVLCDFVAYNLGYYFSWGDFYSAPRWPEVVLEGALATLLALGYLKTITKDEGTAAPGFKADALIYFIAIILLLPSATVFSSSYYFQKGHHDVGPSSNF